MRDDWVLLMRLDDGADPFVLPNDPLLSNTFRLLSHITSFVDHSKHLSLSAFRHAFARFSNFAAARLFSNSSNSPNRYLFTQLQHVPPTNINLTGAPHSLAALFCHALSTFFRRPDAAQPLPILSLAAAIIPPLDNLTSPMFPAPSADAQVQMMGSLNKTPCDVLHPGCLAHSMSDLDWIRRAVEPVTGIEFPGVLNNILPNQNQSNLSSEVLVGTGSRTMTIIKIKSLKVYAFGFYVHPYSVCQKLGSKYASIPAPELKHRNDFYEDLLRDDIGMTVRLVVNCNGMKITAVKDAFEKSLRARLLKTNPETDFKCIAKFGSYFTKDIPLPVGTVIDFRRTADGQLITEIGGNQIGAVQSRELCRAFFDMYLGEVPVSKETKEVIGSNVASIVRRC